MPEQFAEVANRRIEQVDKTLAAVNDRLLKEISFWQDRWIKLSDELAAGKGVRVNEDNVTRTIKDLKGRLENRKRELQAMRHVVNGTPVVLGGALVVPAGLRAKKRCEEPTGPVVAFAAEEARGGRVVDVSADKCGWDLTSYPPAIDGKVPEPRHIEVKDRIKGVGTVTITRNEMLYAFRQGEEVPLAVVLVGEGDAVEGSHYIRDPFNREPGWGRGVDQFQPG